MPTECASFEATISKTDFAAFVATYFMSIASAFLKTDHASFSTGGSLISLLDTIVYNHRMSFLWEIYLSSFLALWTTVKSSIYAVFFTDKTTLYSTLDATFPPAE